jgi:homocysteine S-methyltransferase
MKPRPPSTVDLLPADARFAVVDGGLSTALEQLGHHPAGALWTAQFVVDQPSEIVKAHELYVAAGAQIVITSSYQASVAGFTAAGLDRHDAQRALASTTGLARLAGAPIVAASVGPFGAVLGDGSEYHGAYSADWATVREFHRERIAVLADSGPDLFAVETIPSRIEAEIVAEEIAARTDLPFWITFTCADDVRTCAGDKLAEAVAAVGAARNLVAVGVNCTAPLHVAGLLTSVSTSLPLIVYPNHGGTWDAAARTWHHPHNDRFDELADEWIACGAVLIGGCCGVGPDGIAALAKLAQPGH